MDAFFLTQLFLWQHLVATLSGKTPSGLDHGMVLRTPHSPGQ